MPARVNDKFQLMMPGTAGVAHEAIWRDPVASIRALRRRVHQVHEDTHHLAIAPVLRVGRFKHD